MGAGSWEVGAMGREARLTAPLAGSGRNSEGRKAPGRWQLAGAAGWLPSQARWDMPVTTASSGPH